ncbi:MAG: hypothetical protein ABSH09_16830 [Bryobacteraceae bacterium]|jgi:Ca2+/H+ antiporter, TMEM165/GDT1 family
MRRMRFVGVRFVLFGILFIGVVGLLIFGLWNALIPAILGLPKIGFWQALGLFILSRVLFGRFGGHWGSKMGGPRFARGWNRLTPEERQRFREAMGSRCPSRFGEGEAPEKV